MKSKRAIRIISDIFNTLLICLGSTISLALPTAATGTTIVSFFAIVICSLGLIIFVIDCIAAFKSAEATLHSTFIALFFLLLIALSPDMCCFYRQMGVNLITWLMDILSYLSFTGLMLSIFAFYRYTYRPKGKHLSIVPMFIIGGLCFIAYTLLTEYRLQHIALSAFILAIIVWAVYVRIRSYKTDIDNLNFYATSIMIASAIGMQLVNTFYYMGVFASSEGWTIFYSWIIICCFAVIYFNTFLRYAKAALHLNEYKLQTERLKMQVLIGQIKPHFIFNSLTTVKSMYHANTADGDRALELFSELIRDSLSMIDCEMVPFEKELQNITRYIDFINMSKDKEFNIIYNIDTTDFYLPAFTIQPFVENAVKYSRVNEREDGYIMISTSYDEDGIELRVTDNGVGFDINEVKKDSHGIRNSCERLKLLLNTTPVIESKPFGGTEIIIRIKATDLNEKGEQGVRENQE